LSATKFTIDQINGKIFNKEPLPYQFQVDSVLLNIQGADLYSPFTLVQLHLYPDSTIFWIQTDSVAIDRLYGITTTAADGITSKYYDFALNIYQEDPYKLTWEHIKSDYLPTPVELSADNRFPEPVYHLFQIRFNHTGNVFSCLRRNCMEYSQSERHAPTLISPPAVTRPTMPFSALT